MSGAERDDRTIEELRARLTDTPPSSPSSPSSPSPADHDAACALVEALRRRRRRTTPPAEGGLPALAEAVHRLRIVGNPDDMLRQACVEASELGGLEDVTVSAVGPDGHVHPLHASRFHVHRLGVRRLRGTGDSPSDLGNDGTTAGRASSVLPGSPEESAIETRTPTLTDGTPGPVCPEHRHCVVVPILSSGSVAGLFHASHLPERPVEAHRVANLAAFAAAFALVWHTAALEHRWQQRAVELAETVSATLGPLPDPDQVDLPVPREPAEPTGRPAVGIRSLTPRERIVLDQVLAGAANREIAAALVVSVETVKSHVKSILRKVGAANRAELISRTYRS